MTKMMTMMTYSSSWWASAAAFRSSFLTLCCSAMWRLRCSSYTFSCSLNSADKHFRRRRSSPISVRHQHAHAREILTLNVVISNSSWRQWFWNFWNTVVFVTVHDMLGTRKFTRPPTLRTHACTHTHTHTTHRVSVSPTLRVRWQSRDEAVRPSVSSSCPFCTTATTGRIGTT